MYRDPQSCISVFSLVDDIRSFTNINRTELREEEKVAYIRADVCLVEAPSKLHYPGAVSGWDDLQVPHLVQSAMIHNIVSHSL